VATAAQKPHFFMGRKRQILFVLIFTFWMPTRDDFGRLSGNPITDWVTSQPLAGGIAPWGPRESKTWWNCEPALQPKGQER